MGRFVKSGTTFHRLVVKVGNIFLRTEQILKEVVYKQRRRRSLVLSGAAGATAGNSQ